MKTVLCLTEAKVVFLGACRITTTRANWPAKWLMLHAVTILEALGDCELVELNDELKTIYAYQEADHPYDPELAGDRRSGLSQK